MQFHSWERREAILCSMKEPKHPEGTSVQAYYIKHGEQTWRFLNGVQFADLPREGELITKKDSEETFDRISYELSDLSTLLI